VRLGVVVIGRNEGERLRRCFGSLGPQAEAAVYVDSGSTDESVALARSFGIDVVALDPSQHFTAARARNAGFDRLIKRGLGVSLVQFVDGDCEIAVGWLDRAVEELKRQEDLAIVRGRRRERFPTASLYNRLCDHEWDTPAGEAEWCGGDFMIRVAAFVEVDGFAPSFIAGEEPEMCIRLRAHGWRILCVDAEMTLHDAAMLRFSQWWRRSMRAGHAFTETAWTHGRRSGWYGIRPVLSLSGVACPMAALIPAWAKYADAFRKISLARRSSRFSRSSSLIRACSSVVRPPRRPESTSVCRTHLRRVSDEHPIFSAIEQIASHSESYSRPCSKTIRTARSRTSWECLLVRAMTPSSQGMEPPANPGRFRGWRRRPLSRTRASSWLPDPEAVPR